ncbi:MAG: hypothetical protein HOO97_04215 [Sideroxydans sp.]|nr:hypothetical protein [Sideroxydans sp.]NOT98283.1 hypothetical protein [Sideroxydans sp.]
MVTRTPTAARKPSPARKPAIAKVSAPASPTQVVAKNISAPKVAAKVSKKHKKEKRHEDKLKVVRDSFTMPQNDYDLIATLKAKALSGGVHAKKSELLRAGLHLLIKVSATQLKSEIAALEIIKTGRPKKG